MNEAAAALMSRFEGAARTAQESEAAFRKAMAAEIGRLEREREIAFRRTHLIGLLVSSAAGIENADEAISAQCAAVREEFGWYGESDAHKSIIEEMRPLARAVWQCVRETEAGPAEAVTAALEKFEAWFLEARGTPFYVLFDQYVPEAPLIDF